MEISHWIPCFGCSWVILNPEVWIFHIHRPMPYAIKQYRFWIFHCLRNILFYFSTVSVHTMLQVLLLSGYQCGRKNTNSLFTCFNMWMNMSCYIMSYKSLYIANTMAELGHRIDRQFDCSDLTSVFYPPHRKLWGAMFVVRMTHIRETKVQENVHTFTLKHVACTYGNCGVK